jgi:FkbM family methyltransferase
MSLFSRAKALVKSAIRILAYARLDWLPLSPAAAERWAERMKRWPAIFAQRPYRRLVRAEADTRMEVGLVDVIERSLLVGNRWDEEVLQEVRRVLGPGKVFVDVGANIGYFSLLASRLVGDEGRVLALEPSHANLARLCQHLWMNSAKNVLLTASAAGSEAGVASSGFPTPNNAGAATLRPIGAVRSNLAMTLRLDELLSGLGLVPDLLKIDVEGFELEVLKGMQRTLRQSRPLVICELTERFLAELGQSSRQMLELMESHGYSCRILNGKEAGRVIDSASASLPMDQVDVLFSPLPSSGGGVA